MTRRESAPRWLLEDPASLPRGERLLLHVCCGPCSCGSLSRLAEAFRVSLYFYNPNIQPEEEYVRRLEAARLLARHAGRPLIVGGYRPDLWQEALRGGEKDPEAGERCAICIGLRLQETARLAAAQGFPHFGTTLTVSPRKQAAMVNRLGGEAAARHGVRFLRCDLKKNDGSLQAQRLSRELELYRQDYCGCIFSRRSAQRAEAGQGKE